MSKITLEVSIKQFKTQQLISELWERVYDNLSDEEPQYDPALIALPHYEKDSLRQALEEVMEKPLSLDPDERPWAYDCSGNKVARDENGEPMYNTLWTD